MKTNALGLALIKQYEGCELEAYQDSVGVWTIGYGHTFAAGAPNPRRGMRITQAEAERILQRDLIDYEDHVEKYMRREPTMNQFAAMVSLCFNIGPEAFRKSSIIRHFNAGNDQKAADAFLLYKMAGGRPLAGLLKRRKAERRLFLSQTAPSKWSIAAAGGAAAGPGFLATFGEAAASSLGYSLADVMSWQFLLGAGVVTGVLAAVVLVAMGHDRRERLWDRLFGGWLS